MSPKLPEENKNNKDDPYGKSLIVPYWIVGVTEVKSFANMSYSTVCSAVATTVDTTSVVWGPEITIKVLTNDKDVKMGDELLIYKAPEKATAMKLAAPVDKDTDKDKDKDKDADKDKGKGKGEDKGKGKDKGTAAAKKAAAKGGPSTSKKPKAAINISPLATKKAKGPR